MNIASDEVSRLFNFRGETPEAAIQLARKFREMAGFTSEEIDEIAAMAQADRQALLAASATA